MSADIRAALERLVELDDGKGPTPAIATAWTDSIAEARAALAAEPVGEGPSLRWTENMPPSEDCRYDHCTAETPFGRFLISWKDWKQFDSPTVDETPWGDWYRAFDSVDAAKAACQKEMDERLARWGRPTPPAPAPELGEGSKLVEELELMASQAATACQFGDAKILSDAATLLQQQAAPAPVAVSERLPQPEDCDAEGVCWFWEPGGCWWEAYAEKIIASAWKDTYTHWLPHHAIPVPQAGEVPNV